MGEIVVSISGHARFEMEWRQIDESVLRGVVENPQQSAAVAKGRSVCQSRYFDAKEGKEMLLRVVVEPTGGGMLVITVYKTSRIEKYWR